MLKKNESFWHFPIFPHFVDRLEMILKIFLFWIFLCLGMKMTLQSNFFYIFLKIEMKRSQENYNTHLLVYYFWEINVSMI